MELLNSVYVFFYHIKLLFCVSWLTVTAYLWYIVQMYRRRSPIICLVVSVFQAAFCVRHCQEFTSMVRVSWVFMVRWMTWHILRVTVPLHRWWRARRIHKSWMAVIFATPFMQDLPPITPVRGLLARSQTTIGLQANCVIFTVTMYADPTKKFSYSTLIKTTF